VKSYSRARRTDESVRQTLAQILLTEVKDPRVELVTITSVVVSPDLRHANVYLTTHGGPDRYKETLAGLQSAKGRIRSALGRDLVMKYVPDLHFFIDESVDEGQRISEKLHELRDSVSREEDAAPEPDAAGSEGSGTEAGSPGAAADGADEGGE
jgi:ribosome-binding factor A